MSEDEWELSDFKFKAYTRDWYIARDLLEGLNREQIARKYFPKIAKTDPWIFRENIHGRREDKDLVSQRRLLLWQIGATIGKMKQKNWHFVEAHSEQQKWTNKERRWVRWRQNFIWELSREMQEQEENPEPPIPEPGSVTPVVHNPSDPIGAREIVAERVVPLPEDVKDEYGNTILTWEFDENKVPVSTEHRPKITIEQKLDRFYERLMYARHFVTTRELAGQFLDFISTRALKDGCKAIVHGISVNEVMLSITKTWPTDAKNELAGWDTKWEQSESTLEWWEYPSEMEGAHRYLGYITCLAKGRIPIFLVGPSGCGKSFLARDLADALGMEYAELPLTAGATPSWLVGAETITGYKSRPFVEIYRDGGVFCFEELDAADPNMLLLVNNALANEALTNPVTGEEIKKHKDFIPVATANTWGLGANRQFTARERLDAATLDRWRVGRVEMDYDELIEQEIVDYWKTQAEKPRRVKKGGPNRRVISRA